MQKTSLAIWALLLTAACSGGSVESGPVLGGIGGASPGGGCTYPGSSGTMANGETIPAFRWTDAELGDGQALTFDLEEFHCGNRWKDYTSLVIVVGTGWCPNCPDFIRAVNEMSPTITENGGLILYLETEDASYAPATSESAVHIVNGLIDDGPGIRAGDGNNSQPSAIGNQIYAVPTAFWIRKSDMEIVSQADVGYVLPFTQMTADPEADWVTMLGGGGFMSNCGPADEESSEPNNSPAEAGPLPVGMQTGGICDEAGDYYEITIDGAWQLDIEFTHAVGDLDAYVVGESGERLAASDSQDDNETLTYEGPAIVTVVGYGEASAPYTLRLSAL